jgi:hypothetical protein
MCGCASVCGCAFECVDVRLCVGVRLNVRVLMSSSLERQRLLCLVLAPQHLKLDCLTGLFGLMPFHIAYYQYGIPHWYCWRGFRAHLLR